MIPVKDNRRGDDFDSEVIRRVLEGDVNAFESLMDKYGDRVCRIVRNHVPRDHTEEVVHEVFVRAYRSLPGYTAKAPFGHWLSKIAVRCCYDFFRNRRRNREIVLTNLTEDHQKWVDAVRTAESHEVFEKEAGRKEAGEVLEYALERLSAADRMVLTMLHLDGVPVKEAADLLGWSVVGVKVRAYRAKRKMRKIVSELLDEKDHEDESR
ncbi:MAG TPA: RNA polymerase sigma factor [Syntrophobacter fumaroxidans]|nr:RNA polymerase sigma factor [Syntrophobacter fumaroxidans]